MVDSDVQY